MKKIAYAVIFAAGIAFGGDYITLTMSQAGNGTNGMTQAAPTAATDGISAQSSLPSISARAVANQAVVTIASASGAGALAKVTSIKSFMRGWRYGANPDGGTTNIWAPMPQLDIDVDAGSTLPSPTSLAFGPISLPPSPPGTRFSWTAENVSQATTQDAGINVLFELFTP